ncbi:hypothetical protein EUX98_g3111 [Antrodiella citrinella]|uniref:Peptide hydrolase n=1 Tax=Antrodiella citrinella TaxID=2447956 RepID=A0A4V3XIZ2_9APHY|nr:hypothetical protein EUX98_g3111 [Antrodiella citrinella]
MKLPVLLAAAAAIQAPLVQQSLTRLVEVDGQVRRWMSEADKRKVTDTPNLGSFAHLRSAAKPTYPALNHSHVIRPVLDTLSTQHPKENLKEFTSFTTRYYQSETGRQSQQWLLSRISNITAEYSSETVKDKITITQFKHPWGQHSIIARINGSSTTDDAIIIIGAHQDSTNRIPALPSPGADDDASGTVTILETYRALIAADFSPVRPVEFHWYAGEEGGLLGSAAVAQAYEVEGANVYAMLQLDMTAWVKNGTREEIGVFTDAVDPSLTEFNKKLVDAYVDLPWVETTYPGRACSDHFSWTQAGYPSSSYFEGAFENVNRNVHSINDRWDISPEFSFEHMLEFSKLGVAFAVELAGWTQA